MIDRLRRAVDDVTHLAEEAEQLPLDEQEALAARIEALANELRWQQLLDDPARAKSVDALADEALADYAAGRTRPLSDILEDDRA